MARHRDPANERRWQELIRRWQQSGLAVRSFCAHHRLCEGSFYAWWRRLRQRALRNDPPAISHRRATAPPVFVPVALDTDPAALPAIDLVLSQGRLLRVRPGFDPDVLRQLLRLLEEPSC